MFLSLHGLFNLEKDFDTFHGVMEFPFTKTWLWTGEKILSDHAGCVHKARDTQRFCLEKREGHVDLN